MVCWSKFFGTRGCGWSKMAQKSIPTGFFFFICLKWDPFHGKTAWEGGVVVKMVHHGGICAPHKYEQRCGASSEPQTSKGSWVAHYQFHCWPKISQPLACSSWVGIMVWGDRWLGNLSKTHASLGVANGLASDSTPWTVKKLRLHENVLPHSWGFM